MNTFHFTWSCGRNVGSLHKIILRSCGTNNLMEYRANSRCLVYNQISKRYLDQKTSLRWGSNLHGISYQQ